MLSTLLTQDYLWQPKCHDLEKKQSPWNFMGRYLVLTCLHCIQWEALTQTLPSECHAISNACKRAAGRPLRKACMLLRCSMSVMLYISKMAFPLGIGGCCRNRHLNLPFPAWLREVSKQTRPPTCQIQMQAQAHTTSRPAASARPAAQLRTKQRAT